tara:strand:- start:352 stop:1254 length:903 start_codon:yes stop_codon:yes gene_type:complete
MHQIWHWKNLNIAWYVDGVNNNTSPIAILLIHGFGACKEHWRYNQKAISHLAPTYSIDLCGFGNSSQPRSALSYEAKVPGSFNYSFDNWSQQIIDFCNEIIQKPVILIGNSIGGVIALNASERISKKCIGVILIDCAQRTMDDKRLIEQSILMRFLRPLIKTIVRQRLLSSTLFKNAAQPAFIEKILKIAYPSRSNVNKELVDLLYRPTQRKGASEAFRGFINLFDDHLAPDLLRNIRLPVYLIWGEKDPWEPIQEAREWFHTFKCIKSLDVISNSGHCPHDEMPEKVNPILEKIIQEAM